MHVPFSTEYGNWPFDVEEALMTDDLVLDIECLQVIIRNLAALEAADTPDDHQNEFIGIILDEIPIGSTTYLGETPEVRTWGHLVRNESGSWYYRPATGPLETGESTLAKYLDEFHEYAPQHVTREALEEQLHKHENTNPTATRVHGQVDTNG